MEKVTLPSDGNSGWHKCFGFVEFEHKESVAYSIQLLNGITLYGRSLRVRTAGKTDAPYLAKAKGAEDPSLVAERVGHSTDRTPSLDEASALHPTLGQRLSPPPPFITPNELSCNRVPHPTASQRLPPNELLSDELPRGQMLSATSPPPLTTQNGLVSSDEAPHPMLGQRLSLPTRPLNVLASSDESLHPMLSQRLSPPPPLMIPDGPISSDEPLHPTLGQRLSPRSHMSTNGMGGQRSSLGQRPSPPPAPLFGCSSSWEQVPNYNADNDFYGPHSSPWEQPLPNPITDHMPQQTTHIPLHNHLSSHGEEPHPAQVDSLSFSSHNFMQQERDDDKPTWDRAVHTDDKPSTWTAKEINDRDYHLLQLGETLARYKDIFFNKSQQRI